MSLTRAAILEIRVELERHLLQNINELWIKELTYEGYKLIGKSVEIHYKGIDIFFRNKDTWNRIPTELLQIFDPYFRSIVIRIKYRTMTNEVDLDVCFNHISKVEDEEDQFEDGFYKHITEIESSKHVEE